MKTNLTLHCLWVLLLFGSFVGCISKDHSEAREQESQILEKSKKDSLLLDSFKRAKDQESPSKLDIPNNGNIGEFKSSNAKSFKHKGLNRKAWDTWQSLEYAGGLRHSLARMHALSYNSSTFILVT